MSTEEKDEFLEELVEITESDTLDFTATAEPEPTPTPKKRKSRKKKEQPCVDCPDYSEEDLLREKVLSFKSKGYNNNQIAAMLGIHKQYVDTIK